MSHTKKKNPPHQVHIPKEEKTLKRFSKTIPAAIFIFILFGLGIAFVAVGVDATALIIGAVVGAICGYLFGHEIAKVLAKR